MSGPGEARLPVGRQELKAMAMARSTAGRVTPRVDANISRWALFWRRLATRQALLRLTDEQLCDIGLTRDEANREAHHPFWML